MSRNIEAYGKEHAAFEIEKRYEDRRLKDSMVEKVDGVSAIIEIDSDEDDFPSFSFNTSKELKKNLISCLFEEMADCVFDIHQAICSYLDSHEYKDKNIFSVTLKVVDSKPDQETIVEVFTEDGKFMTISDIRSLYSYLQKMCFINRD